MKLRLRYYQTAAVNSVMAFFRSKNPGNPLIELPTGSGKSHVLAALCQKIQSQWGEVPILIVSHTQEILEQDYQKLRKYLPEQVIGLYSAGIGIKNIENITVAGIQSIYKRAKEFKHFKLVIIDECHLIPATGEGMYRTLLKGMGNPKLLGLTATPFRTGFGKLTDPGHLFTKIVYRIDIDTLIHQGYLCPLISRAASYQMDPTKQNITVTAGEYVVKQLGLAFDQKSITNHICKELLQYKESRKHWLLFAIDIEHAEHIAEQLAELGMTAMYLHSRMSQNEREMILNLFQEGTIQVLVNVAILTTGFDFPGIDLIGLLRPTMSPVLHVQMIGRGSRIAPDKKDCLILDFASNLQRLGPINGEFDFRKVKQGGEAPTKVCPECSEVLYLSAKQCPCGYKFETEKVTKLVSKAGTAEVLRNLKTYDVSQIWFHRHQKQGSPDSLKVTYQCGLFETIYEWVPLEHPAGRARAEYWWKIHSGKNAPLTVTEALRRQDELIKPKQISVDTGGRFPRVTSYKFTEENYGRDTEINAFSRSAEVRT